MRWISHFSWGGYLTSHWGGGGISHFSQYHNSRPVPTHSDANSIPRLTPRAFSTRKGTTPRLTSHCSLLIIRYLTASSSEGDITLLTILRLTRGYLTSHNTTTHKGVSHFSQYHNSDTNGMLVVKGIGRAL